MATHAQDRSVSHDEKSEYQKKHKPASSFASRADYLNHELQIMRPRRWGLSLPGRDFRFEIEDLVPALAGTIGIIAMYSAVMMSWAEGLTAAWDHVTLGKAFAVEVARVDWLSNGCSNLATGDDHCTIIRCVPAAS